MVAAPDRAAAPVSDPAPRARILVCEDEAPLRELVRVSLGPEFALLEAADGAAALDLFRTERPDLVLLDLMLPVLPGLDVLAAIRADGPTPVIALSAWAHRGPEALEAGADRFVAKPFDPAALRADVLALLEAR